MGLLSVVAACGVGSAVWMHGKLRAYEATMQKAEAARQKAAAEKGKPKEKPIESVEQQIQRELARLRPPKKPAVPPEPKQLKIVGFEFKDGDPDHERAVLTLSERPDMSVFRDYVTVVPQPKNLSVTCNGDWGVPRVFIEGDFAYRTNVTVKVRAGCPALKELKALPLASDFARTFQRKDAPPRVKFVDPGRYLPPGGARLLAIDSVNVSSVYCAAAAIPPANIVQLLARENGRYRIGTYEADSRSTEEIADRLVEWKVETKERLNEHVVSPFKLRTLPDAGSNGVFLVAIRSADRQREEGHWYWEDRRGEKWNPNRYRLVCLTDIGLTVRREGRHLIVWATSLMKGCPVVDCTVEVFGANNRRLGVGRTDAKGLCDIVCTDRAEPFAVVAQAADGKDTSFICLNERQSIEDRTCPNGMRAHYLAPHDVTAYLWSERDIYRHDEPIFLHALVRNGQNEAPKPFPLEFRLVDPDEHVIARKTVMTDGFGAAWYDGFRVPAERPSGNWCVEVATPGQKGCVLADGMVSVEEFAPPQIRVSVVTEGTCATNFAFKVKAEHLYGGPARGLKSAGAVVFQDAPFAPTNWPGWHFGNENLGLKPSYRRLWKFNLNEEGVAAYAAPLLAESGQPKAAVRAIGEGTVFEEGGRPARARGSRLLHYYPFYVGTTLGGNVRIPDVGFARVKVACVKPDGTRLAEARKLKVAFERVESVYGCKEDDRGWTTWNCERVRVAQTTPVAELVTKADGDVEIEIPFRTDGDYALTLTDEASGASFGAAFWLGSRGDDEVRSPLANPSEITITPDRKLYRPGDVPRLLVKAPFAGWALLSVMRDKVVSTRVLKLAGATQELTLEPVEGFWAPNVDVALCVVQSAENGGRHQAARAHGRATLRVRRWENEFPVNVTTAYAVRAGEGGTLTAEIDARGLAATGTVAVVTVVDEGIHLLTGWRTPNPVVDLAAPRAGDLPLFDLFDNLLPVWDGDPAKVRGVKTGGDMGAEMLGRVSPVPTRRFKPLAQWQVAVLLTNGLGRAVFDLPEFVGEVRVTALAYSAKAVGAGDRRQKVTPKLVMQPDGPRFAAPEDVFDVTFTLANRSGAAGACTWKVTPQGPAWPASGEACAIGEEKLAKDASVTRTLRLKAGAVPGEAKIAFEAVGFGERHVQTIDLPIRPAVASRETSGTIALAPGETRTFKVEARGSVPAAAVRRFAAGGSDLVKLAGALEFLADYPHGCLEQTASRIFPLITAGGILNTLAATGGVNRAASNRMAYVEAGVRRVESMVRATDFVMWPDCNYPPWDRDVSLYAAHFLVEAEKAGTALVPTAKERVMKFLERWSREANTVVGAYACHTLALAGTPALDRMLVLYDGRATLNALSRARLARAFAFTGDRERARELLTTCATRPETMKEAAFALLALLELDPADARIAPLVKNLESMRCPERFSWGTTEENAHALLALGAYYRHHPAVAGKPALVLVEKSGEMPLAEKRHATVRGADEVNVVNRGAGTAWLTWRSVELPQANTVTNEAHQIAISRTFYTPEGKVADLKTIERGDLLIVDLALTARESRSFNDLVIQDLFPAAFEPVHGGLGNLYDWIDQEGMAAWVMRSDARDDRMLVFSKKFDLKSEKTVHFYYPVRVVTGGDFILPGPTVEAMYAPEIRATMAPERVVVAK